MAMFWIVMLFNGNVLDRDVLMAMFLDSNAF